MNQIVDKSVSFVKALINFPIPQNFVEFLDNLHK